MAKSNVRSYISNLGKSLSFTAKLAVADAMPSLDNTISQNREIVQSGLSYTKNFMTKNGRKSGGVNQQIDKFLKDVKEIKTNAIKDLRTGKFVNFDRQSDFMMDGFGLGDDFAIDWGDGSNDDPFADPSTEPDPFASVNAIKSSTKVSEMGSNARNRALMETITDSAEASADYLAKTQTKLQSISLNMYAQMHTETVAMLNNTNTLLTSVVEFQNSQIVDHMNKQLSFYDNVLLELRELKEISKRTIEERPTRKTAVEEVFGIDGSIDLKAYGKQIKQNFENMFPMLGMMKTMSSIGGGPMAQLKESPLSFVASLMMTGLMPRSVKDAMGKFDVSFSGLLSSLVLKLNSMKNDITKPRFSLLASILGLDINQKPEVDISNFHRGAMSYNGRADKALTEVIPTILSHILAAINGSNKVALYDYSTGRFTKSSNVVDDHKTRIRNNQRSDMFDVEYEMRQSLGRVKGGNSKQMNKDLQSFIDFLIDHDGFFNPLTDIDPEEMARKGLKLSDPRVYNALRAAFMNMPKHLQTSVSRKILSARTSGDRSARSIERELQESGLSAAYSGLGSFYGPDAKDAGGMNESVSILKDIKKILIDGILVYTQGSKSSGTKDVLKRRSSFKDSQIRASTTSAVGKASESIAEGFGGGSNEKMDELISMPFEAVRTAMATYEQPWEVQEKTISSGFLKSLLSEKSMVKRLKMIKGKITSPGQLLAGLIGRMDNLIYRIIYGKEDKGDGEGSDGDPSKPKGFKFKGLLGRITNFMRDGMDRSITWLDKSILSPMHSRFFGEDGLFTKFAKQFEPFLDKMKEAAGRGFGRVKKFFMGEKTAEGFYTGGALSDIGNMFVDFGNSTRNLLTGGAYTKSDGTKVEKNENNVFSYIKTYSKALFENIKTGLFGEKKEIVKEDGTVVIERDRKGLLTSVVDSLKRMTSSMSSLFQSKEGESPDAARDTINKWKTELKGFLPKGVAGGVAGMAASLVLPGGPILGAMLGSTLAFASHSKEFRDYIFGNEELGKKGVIPKQYVDGFKKYFPSMAGGGLLGMLGSIILPGGPLLGLTVGSAIGYAAKSERAQEFLFGGVDKDGNTKEGLLGREFKDKFKKIFPNMAAGGLLGMAGSIILPGGPLLGLTIGSAIGFATKSERAQEMLFGKTDEHGNEIKKGLIPPEIREKIKKNLPKGMTGALAGALSGSIGFLTPGGPLVGAMIGATLAVAGTSEKFKDILFGKMDPDEEKRKGGLFGKVRDFMNTEIFEPFKAWRQKKKVQIADWFQESIRKPFEAALGPFREAMSLVGKKFKDSFADLKESFKNAFNRVFEKSVGAPLGELVKKHITDPLKNILNRLFNAIGRGLSYILTSPIKFMTTFANSVLQEEEKKKAKEERNSLRETLSDALKNVFSSNKPKETPVEPTGKPEKKNTVKSWFTDLFNNMINANVKVDASSNSDEAKRNRKNFRQWFRNLFSDIITADVKDDGELSSKPKDEKPVDTPKAPKKPDEPIIQTPSAPKSGMDAINEVVHKPESDKKEPDATTHTTSSSSSANTGGATGHINLTKLMSHVNKIEDHLRVIRDEIKGQLNGVGWNLEYIANILTDQFGKPTMMPTEIAKRGNFRRRGLIGTIMNVITSPIRGLGKLAHMLVVEPLKKVGDVASSVVKTVGDVMINVVKLPLKIARGIFQTVRIAADGLLQGVKMVGPAIGQLLLAPFKVLNTVIHATGQAFGTLVKGFGIAITGAVRSAVDLGTSLVSMTTHAIPKVVKGLIDLSSILGSTVLKLANFAKNLVFGGLKMAGRFVGIGKVKEAEGFASAAGGIHRVEVVGGTLEKVETVEKVVKIVDCVGFVGCSEGPLSEGAKGSRFNARRRALRLVKGVPSEDEVKASGRKNGAQVATETETNEPGVTSERKVKGFWRTIGRGMRSLIRSVKHGVLARVDLIGKTVQRVDSSHAYDEATLGMAHQTAVNTTLIADGISAMGKQSSIWDKLLGGLLPLLAGLASLFTNPKKLLSRLASRLGLRTIFGLGGRIAKAIAKITGAKVVGEVAEEALEKGAKNAVKSSASGVVDIAERRAAKEAAAKLGVEVLEESGTAAAREVSDNLVKGSASNVVSLAERKAAKEAATKIGVDVLKDGEAKAIDVVKNDGSKVMTALRNFFQKVFSSAPIQKLGGPGVRNAVDKILTNIGKFAKNPSFIAKMLNGMTKGSIKVSASLATLGLAEIGFAIWNSTTALIHKGDAAFLFNVYEGNVTPKMRLVSSIMKTLLGVSYVFILELLNAVLVELTGGRYNVLLMIANAIYESISDKDAYDDLRNAQMQFEADAAAAGKSKSDWNHEKNARFEEKLWRKTKALWNDISGPASKALDALTPVGTFKAVRSATSTDRVRDALGMHDGQRVNIWDRASVLGGSLVGNMSFGLIDSKWLSKGIRDLPSDILNSAPVETVRNITAGLFNATVSMGSAVGGAMYDIGAAINHRRKETMSGIADLIVSPVRKLFTSVGKSFDELGLLFGDKWSDWVGTSFGGFIELVGDGFKFLGDEFKGAWKTHVAKPMGDLISDMKKGITNLFDFDLGKSINDAWNKTTEKTKDIGNSIADGWDRLWGGRGRGTRAKMEADSSNASDDIKSLGNRISGFIRGDTRTSHASGLDAVPYDNYPAFLHRGEMVIPADQANFLRIISGLPPVQPSNATGPVNASNQLVNSIPAAPQVDTVVRLQNNVTTTAKATTSSKPTTTSTQSSEPVDTVVRLANPTTGLTQTKVEDLLRLTPYQKKFADAPIGTNPILESLQRQKNVSSMWTKGGTLSYSMLHKDDSDEAIIREFGYALRAPQSDMTVDDIRMIKQLCVQYGLDPHLWLALVEVESGYNSKARSKKSTASGWGQVLKATGKWLFEEKLKLGVYDHDLMGTDKHINARMSIYYLASHIRTYGGNIRKALIRYNGSELGEEYANRVERNLFKNTGRMLSQVVALNGTGVNTYIDDGILTSSILYGTDTGPKSMSEFLSIVGKAYTENINERYGGTDITSMLTGASSAFSFADPFYTGEVNNNDALNKILGQGTFEGTVYNTTATDAYYTQFANQGTLDAYSGSLKQKYSGLSGKTNVHDFFADRLNRLAAAYKKTVGISSGWRSDSEQQRLINEWRAKHPGASETERRKWVADVGKGNHSIGMAADVQDWVRNLSNAQLQSYGLWKPLAHENWHVEPIETKVYGRDVSRLRSMFGLPHNPAAGFAGYIKPGYGSGSSYYTTNSMIPAAAQAPTVGNGIGESDTEAYPGGVTGAPSPTTFVERVDTMIKSLNSKATAEDSDMVTLLKIIASGIGKMVDNSDEFNELMRAYLSKRTTSSEASSPSSVAIISSPNSDRSPNPFTGGNNNRAKKVDKSRTIAEIAAGTMY